MAIKRILDVTPNDTNKTFTVPSAETWKVMYGHIELTTTATVGNRIIKLLVHDENGVIVTDSHAGASATAGGTFDYELMQGIFRETSFINGGLQVPIPSDMVLLPGWTLNVVDSAAIDAAQDDMLVSFVVNTHNI